MKLYRSSGSPIDSDHKELYFTDLNAKMDGLEEKLGRCTAANAPEFQKEMELVHRRLTEEYPNEATIKYPGSKTAITRLLEEYGTLAFCIEDGKLVAYIMDS